MRNFMEAYKAVHNTEAKEELTSIRDEISEMNLSTLTDTDLDEIVESVLEEMFQKGYSVDSAHTIFSEMFVESNIDGRQAKIDRLCESLNKAFDVIDSKASTIALEEFGKYRYNKRLQESWSARFNQEKRVQRTHGQLVAQESLNVKTLLLQLVEKADKSYLETDMKKRQENNEKARKEMAKVKGQKNPHFEEVSQIRKGWGDAYRSIYEKKLDPVGKEDGDVDNDGDEDSSDEYLMKRRKAIGKAMGKKKEKVKEEVDPEKAKKTKKTISHMGKGNPHYDAKSAGSSRVKGFKFTPVKEETENVEDFDQMFDSLIEEGYTKSEALQIMTQMALDELYKGKHGQSEKEYADSRSQGGKMVSGDSKMSGAEYTHGRRVKAANPGMQPDVGGKTKPKSQGKMDRGTRADIEYRKALRKEEVEEYVDFLIDEGYDCSDLTWEDMFEEYESLDEGLRSAVKRLLGKKEAPAEKKPESRGEQLRKKYNVGPERSDTSAKRQILDRTRAKAERDQKQYGGSVYSKRVADKSKAAHDRYLKGGYSKYGADDARGSGNKARKRAEALRNK